MRELLIQTALMAGKEILKIRDGAGFSVSLKDDQSPVTLADQNAERIITQSLEELFPEHSIVAEERVSIGIMPQNCASYFLIDALDGTKEFISGKDDFTVNIAYIQEGTPVFGIVYAPALKVLWVGEDGFCEKLTINDAFEVLKREAIQTRERPFSLVAVISRSHCNERTDQFVQDNGYVDTASIGSSLKFCLLAEGLADVYPRFSRTMQWDTAAGDAVLRAAGGKVLQLDGSPLKYLFDINQLELLANPDFIAWGRAE